MAGPVPLRNGPIADSGHADGLGNGNQNQDESEQEVKAIFDDLPGGHLSIGFKNAAFGTGT